MEASKRFQVESNVTFRVLDRATGKLIREHKGHNAATNTLIEGVGHYLIGDGVLHQGQSMLSRFIPKYISLGTMGLRNQNQDSEYLPTGLSGSSYTGSDEAERLQSFMDERPGYGSDGYSAAYNNNRPYFGLGPPFTSFSITQSYYKNDIVYYNGVAYRATTDMIADPDNGIYNMWNSKNWTQAAASFQPTCHELITPEHPRVEISFRDVVPEYEAEKPKSIDVIYSAMISTGALAEFRDPDKDYIFITESGLWADLTYYSDTVGDNGLVAGYRVAPPSRVNWYMKAEFVPEEVAIGYCKDHGIPDPTDAQIAAAKISAAAENRHILKEQVLRVERDQVVQVIWKIQIGNLSDIEDTTMSWISGDIEQQMKELYELVQKKSISSVNVGVSSAKWTRSNVSADYPYEAVISVPGVDSNYFSIVQFADSDVQAFDFAPFSKTGAGTITIYCRTQPSRTITLPIISCSTSMQVRAT